MISLSNVTRNDGNITATTIILTIAPLDISEHKEPIISTLEYTPTPKVAAKKPSALTITYGIDVESAIEMASFLEAPSNLSFL